MFLCGHSKLVDQLLNGQSQDGVSPLNHADLEVSFWCAMVHHATHALEPCFKVAPKSVVRVTPQEKWNSERSQPDVLQDAERCVGIPVWHESGHVQASSFVDDSKDRVRLPGHEADVEDVGLQFIAKLAGDHGGHG